MKRTIDIEPEPEETADHFAEWGSDRQTLFLNTVALRFYGWNSAIGAERQALEISKGLTDKAKDLIAALHHFANGDRP